MRNNSSFVTRKKAWLLLDALERLTFMEKQISQLDYREFYGRERLEHYIEWNI